MMKSFMAALSFLTIIPVPRRWADSAGRLESGFIYFPPVGLLLGVLTALLFKASYCLLPLLPACVLAVIFMVAVSGGLHMDGLADTADGFFSARPRERILEIMKDSRIGTMGVIAVVSVLILKIALLASVPPRFIWGTLLLMPLAGRSAILIQMALLSYVRAETGGIASVFNHRSARGAAFGGAVLLLISGWFIADWRGLVAGFAALFLAAAFSGYVYRKIGGYTGDTLGAGCELIELVPPLTMIVLSS